MRERVGVGMPLVLGFMPGPGMLPTVVGGIAASRAREPKPLPIEVLRPELMPGTIDKRARELAFGWSPDPVHMRPQLGESEKGDVKRFEEELKKLGKDRAAVDKYVKEFLAARGLTTFGASTEARDEWSLADDPNLAPLVDAQTEAQRESRFNPQSPHGGAYMPFGRSFFWKINPETRTLQATAGLYQAEQYPAREWRPGQMRYVVWRTEDKAAAPQAWTEAEPAVRAAWKRIKARKMAEDAANRMAETIRNSTYTSDLTLQPTLGQLAQDLRYQATGPKASAAVRRFDIPNVAPLVLQPGQFGGPPQLVPFGLTESEDIPYPTREMVTALLDNREKPFKTVLVLPDAPKDVFYVATLMNRTLKTTEDFRRDVFPRTGPAHQVLDLFRVELVKRGRDSMVDLLKKEFRFEVTDAQRQALEKSIKSEGR
jgi:hypothetical protein